MRRWYVVPVCGGREGSRRVKAETAQAAVVAITKKLTTDWRSVETPCYVVVESTGEIVCVTWSHHDTMARPRWTAEQEAR